MGTILVTTDRHMGGVQGERNISQLSFTFPPTGAVFDENTGKILVVQDRNKVSCFSFLKFF